MSTKTVRTTCSYCSVGCNFDVDLENGAVTRFMPSKTYPVNRGKSCPKGFNLLTPFAAPDRATVPLVRGADGELHSTDWDTALDLFVRRFGEVIDRHGPESAAFLSTGQIPFEEMAFLGAVAKFGLGMYDGDGNTRQCMATAAVAYKQAFGFDAPPFSYTDLEESDLMIFVGANPVIAHPVLWNRVKANPHNPTVLVVDPRATKTAREATLHLQIQPKGDLALLYAIANVLIRRGWIDRDYIAAHTVGFEEFAAHVAAFDPDTVGPRVGLAAEQIVNVAQRIHDARAVSIWWTMGVNQSHQGVRTAQAIINLCLITGNIGRPGTGPNSITGQANAMGSRLFSATTVLYGGYDFADPAGRALVAKTLGIDESRIPPRATLPYNKILDAVDEGKIKALWFVATNPAHSWIDKHELFRRFNKLEFLVVQDLFTTTETAQAADLILPAAGSGEKTGTLINSERRLGVVQKVLEPPGDARSDFDILRAIADRLPGGPFLPQWNEPEAVFRDLARISRGRPCDISGIHGYEQLRARGGVQWPYPTGTRPGDSEDAEDKRLFADGNFFTPDGKARMLFTAIEAVPEPTDGEYPFVLLTGRGSAVQFHTQTRTGKVPMLTKLYPADAYIEINPRDAERLGIGAGARVRVSARRGEVIVNAVLTEDSAEGQVFMPMHYPETNYLTFPAFDPLSFEPSYKYAAVNLEGVG